MLERWNDNEENTAVGGLRGAWKRVSTTLRARARLRRQQTARVRSQRLKYITQEQLAYADLLETGVMIGRHFLLATFILYVTGIIAPKVPLSELTDNWSLPAEHYSSLVGIGTGWSWLKLLQYGDYLNFLGIAFLASITIFCYVRLLPISLHNKDVAFSMIVLLEILVLILAASGLLAISHSR